MTADHVGGGRRLVEKDEAVGIEIGLGVEPGEARLLHVRAFLIGCVDRPFLRVMPRRTKKRARPLMPVCTPCSRSRAQLTQEHLRRASQVFNTNAACASMRCEVRSPSVG